MSFLFQPLLPGSAQLLAGPPPATTGYIKVYLSGTWEQKPVKYWDGSQWTIKPVKHWNGSQWVATV